MTTGIISRCSPEDKREEYRLVNRVDARQGPPVRPVSTARRLSCLPGIGRFASITGLDEPAS